MRRRRLLGAARAAFVLLAVASAWWGFRGRWPEIGGALAAVGPLRLGTAVACAVTGLVLTGLLWRLLLRSVGSEVSVRDAGVVFFLGQLGKYVPGSVWSVAAQAQLGRRHDVPVRSSVTASALFLLVHTATGLLLGGLLVVGGALGGTVRSEVGGPWPVIAVVVGALALLPPLLRRLGDRLAGAGAVTTIDTPAVVGAMALMALVWACYGGSLALLVPGPGSPAWVGVVAAFALAHAAGVLVVFAPAGVGAREAVLVALLAPSVGVPAAAAAALLSRLAHALADFLVVGAAIGWSRGGRSVPAPEPVRASAS